MPISRKRQILNHRYLDYMKTASINPFIDKGLDSNSKEIDNSPSTSLSGWFKSFFIASEKPKKLSANQELENKFNELIKSNSGEEINLDKNVTVNISDAKSAVNLAKKILNMAYGPDEVFNEDFITYSEVLKKYEDILENSKNNNDINKIEKNADEIITKSILKTWIKEIKFIIDLIKVETSGDKLKEYKNYLLSLNGELSQEKHQYLQSKDLKKIITYGITEVENAIKQIGNKGNYLGEDLEVPSDLRKLDSKEDDPYSIEHEEPPGYLSKDAFKQIEDIPRKKQSTRLKAQSSPDINQTELGSEDIYSRDIRIIEDELQLLYLQEEMSNLPQSPTRDLKKYHEINSSAANNIPPQDSINQDNLALNSRLPNFKFLETLDTLRPDKLSEYTFEKAIKDGYHITNELLIKKNDYVGKITELDDSENTPAIIKAEFNINRKEPYYDMLKPIFMATIQKCKDEKVDISEFELSLKDMESEDHATQLCRAFIDACEIMGYKPSKMISLNLSPKGIDAMNNLEVPYKNMFSQSLNPRKLQNP